MGIAPTGKQVTVTGMGICLIVNGKIQEDQWTDKSPCGAD